MNGFRMMNGGMSAIACCMGLKISLSQVIPNDVCWIFSDIFWTFLSETFVVSGLI